MGRGVRPGVRRPVVDCPRHSVVGHALGRLLLRSRLAHAIDQDCRRAHWLPPAGDGDRSVGGDRSRRGVLAADTLTGDKVVNRQKEDLGTIEHLMIDVEQGRIAYAVLSFGGFLGMGDKLFAIPWSALAVDTVERQFILNVDKKLLERAPGFDKDHWPNMADRTWGAESRE